MNILYASNDGFARHLGTSMYSLFDKNRGAKTITVYVLSLGLSEENIGKLQTIANIFNRELVILELGDIRKRFDFDVDTGGYDISIMGRLFMGEMLPEHVDRVLYLDCDTVIVMDEGKIIGMGTHGHLLETCPEYKEISDSQMGGAFVE